MYLVNGQRRVDGAGEKFRPFYCSQYSNRKRARLFAVARKRTLLRDLYTYDERHTSLDPTRQAFANWEEQETCREGERFDAPVALPSLRCGWPVSTSSEG